MARTITTAVKVELAADRLHLVHLVEIHLSTTSYYLTDAYKLIAWNGNDYLALGHFLQFDGIEETGNIQVNDTVVSLSGVDQTLISAFLTEDYINRSAKIYLAALDPTTQALEVDPVLMIDGLMDNPVVDDDPDSGKSLIALTIVNHWADARRVNGRRTNHETQQIFFPGDKGFEFASELQKELIWGKAD